VEGGPLGVDGDAVATVGVLAGFQDAREGEWEQGF
jgi:predicted component of type VI protein secretion system